MTNNAAFLDDQTAIYPAGSQIVLYEVDQKTQRFLPIHEPDGISTMCVSPQYKSMALAVKGTFKENLKNEGGVEQEEKGASIVTFDLVTLKKKKIFTVPHDTSIKVGYI